MTAAEPAQESARPEPGASAERHKGRVAATAIVAVALALRVPTLGSQSFWLDEAYTERLMRMSFSAMLHGVARTESTPPLYYVLAWIWTRLFGTGEAGLRSLSMVAGCLTVLVVYTAARRLAGRRAAVIAGLLIAVLPLMVWYSQEARAYALGTLFTACSFHAAAAYWQTLRRQYVIWWALAAALALVTHYFTAFVVFPEAVVLVVAARRGESDMRAVWKGLAAVGAVAVALIPLALAQENSGHAAYIAQGSLSARILQIPKQLLVGYASPHQLLTTVAAFAFVATGVVASMLAGNEPVRRTLLAVFVGGTATIGAVVLALVGVDFLNTRNLLAAVPALAVVIAAVFAAEGRTDSARWLGRGGAAGLVIVCAVIVLLVNGSPQFQREDWRGVSRALGRATAGPRVVVVSAGYGLITLQAYRPRLRLLTQTVRVRELDVAAVPIELPSRGIGPPVPPSRTLPVPAGFRLYRTMTGRTYTVFRYRASSPIAIPPTYSGEQILGPGAYATLLDPG